MRNTESTCGYHAWRTKVVRTCTFRRANEVLERVGVFQFYALNFDFFGIPSDLDGFGAFPWDSDDFHEARAKEFCSTMVNHGTLYIELR